MVAAVRGSGRWEGNTSTRGGFLGGSVVRESACLHRRRPRRGRFDPWVRKMPWRRKWQPDPVSCLENPMDRGGWWGTVHEVAESQTLLTVCVCTHTNTHTHTHTLKGKAHLRFWSCHFPSPSEAYKLYLPLSPFTLPCLYYNYLDYLVYMFGTTLDM